MTNHRVLIIDDHLVTCKGYEYFFENATNAGLIPNFEVTFAHDCESAYHQINNSKKGNPYDLFLLDIQLPPYPREKIYSGEDLGLLIRLNCPNAKIVVQTSNTANHLLYNIFKSLNPEGIIVKGDLVEENFTTCIKNILKDAPFYTRTFSNLLRNQLSKGYILEEDRKLLYLLNIGLPAMEISKRMLWSSSKVEKRKRLLREKFGVHDKNVQSLLNAARESGFL